MPKIEYWFKQDLKKPVRVNDLNGVVFTLDNVGSRIGVEVFDDGEPVTLTGTVNGYVIIPGETTVSVAGTRSNNTAYIELPQSALAIPGFIKIAIKLTNSSEITTLLSVVATVYRSRTDTIITPSQQIITDWSQQIAAEMQAVEDASAAQDAKIDDLESSFEQLTGSRPITGWSEGHYLVTNGTSVNTSDIKNSGNVRYIVISCSPGDVFTLNNKGGNTSRAYVFCKSNYDILDSPKAGANEQETDLVVVAPASSAYLVLNDTKVNGAWNDICFYGKSITGLVRNDYTDSEGSVFDSVEDYVLSAENATKKPIYSYHFKTYQAKTIEHTSGQIIPSSLKSVTQIIKIKGQNLLFKLTDAALTLINSGGTVQIDRIYEDSNGNIYFDGISHVIGLESQEIMNYCSLIGDYAYACFIVTVPSGATAVSDINDYIQVFKASPFYQNNSPAFQIGVTMGPQELNAETNKYEGNLNSNQAGKVWSIVLDTKDIKYVYSDVVAFDYAFCDRNDVSITQLTGHYTTCCIEIPKYINGKKVEKLRANIRAVGRYDEDRTDPNDSRWYYNIYNLLPWIQTNVFVGYEGHVDRSVIQRKGISTAIKNVKTILGLYEKPYSEIRPQSVAGNVSNVYIYSNYTPGLLYRSVSKNIVGMSVPFESYLSAFNSFPSVNNSQVGSKLMDGQYGVNCSGFLFNIMQNPAFLSTTTFEYLYKSDDPEANRMIQISDMSETEIGDVVFWDGLTGTPKRSNHVAFVVDKITIDNELKYVVTVESGNSCGARYHIYHYPFDPGDRIAYVVRFNDLNVNPIDITEQSWFSGDSDILNAYITTDKPGLSSYSRVYDCMSYWGIRHNDYDGSLGNLYVRAESGTPVNYKLRVHFYGNDSVAEYTTDFIIANIINTGTTQNFRTISYGTIIPNGQYGKYDISVNSEDEGTETEFEYAFTSYYYDKNAYNVSGQEVSISDFVDKGYDIDRTFAKIRTEHGLGRADQYRFRKLTAEEISQEKVVLTQDTVMILTYNDCGALFLNVTYSQASGGDEEEDPDVNA